MALVRRLGYLWLIVAIGFGLGVLAAPGEARGDGCFHECDGLTCSWAFSWTQCDEEDTEVGPVCTNWSCSVT